MTCPECGKDVEPVTIGPWIKAPNGGTIGRWLRHDCPSCRWAWERIEAPTPSPMTREATMTRCPECGGPLSSGSQRDGDLCHGCFHRQHFGVFSPLDRPSTAMDQAWQAKADAIEREWQENQRKCVECGSTELILNRLGPEFTRCANCGVRWRQPLDPRHVADQEATDAKQGQKLSPVARHALDRLKPLLDGTILWGIPRG